MPPKTSTTKDIEIPVEEAFIRNLLLSFGPTFPFLLLQPPKLELSLSFLFRFLSESKIVTDTLSFSNVFLSCFFLVLSLFLSVSVSVSVLCLSDSSPAYRQEDDLAVVGWSQPTKVGS
jgi:hypothetical protein